MMNMNRVGGILFLRKSGQADQTTYYLKNAGFYQQVIFYPKVKKDTIYTGNWAFQLANRRNSFYFYPKLSNKWLVVCVSAHILAFFTNFL